MKDKDIVKAVVGLKAATDLNEIRAHLDKLEVEKKEQQANELHAKEIEALSSEDYIFLINRFHEHFCWQKKEGKDTFVGACMVKCFLHLFWVGPFIWLCKYVSIDSFGGKGIPGLLFGFAIGSLPMLHCIVTQQEKYMGILKLFQAVWTGEKEDLEDKKRFGDAMAIIKRNVRESRDFAGTCTIIAAQRHQAELDKIRSETDRVA